MLGQFPNRSKRGVASLRDSAADEELVAATRSGDELAFESLFKRHRRRIFALALRYTGVREDAEDIVQQTFQKAFVHLHEFEGKSSFSTWATRIAINQALMSLRTRRALREVSMDDLNSDDVRPLVPEPADANPDPEVKCSQKERARIFEPSLEGGSWVSFVSERSDFGIRNYVFQRDDALSSTLRQCCRSVLRGHNGQWGPRNGFEGGKS